MRCVSHRKYGRLFLLRKPFQFFVFPFKKAQYVVVFSYLCGIDFEKEFYFNNYYATNASTNVLFVFNNMCLA